MFLKFKKPLETIFLDPYSDRFEIEDEVNVILSPSLYWVKKLTLPVKSIRDVKPLLSSLFEDSIPDGNYSYSVYKSGAEFYIFAYEDKVILDTLQDKGISAKQVQKVYFAQSEFDGIDGAMKINEKQSIYVKDGVVVLVPCCWIEEKSELDLQNIKLSKRGIRLKQFGHIVDEKSIYSIIFVLLFFIFIMVVEYAITLKNISSVDDLRAEVFVKNDLKPTMMQNQSMLKTYKSLHEKETKLRTYISYILNINLKETQNLSLLSLKERKLIVEFEGLQRGEELKIINYFKEKKMVFSSKFKINSWHVEVEL